MAYSRRRHSRSSRNSPAQTRWVRLRWVAQIKAKFTGTLRLAPSGATSSPAGRAGGGSAAPAYIADLIEKQHPAVSLADFTDIAILLAPVNAPAGSRRARIRSAIPEWRRS